MSLNYNEIGKNIREVRKENGLSQAMLSELVEKCRLCICCTQKEH